VDRRPKRGEKDVFSNESLLVWTRPYYESVGEFTVKTQVQI